MMEKRATLRDIAKAAGVSVASVSNAINGVDKISEETRERIYQVMQDMDYQQNLVARTLSRGVSEMIGLLLPITEEDSSTSLLLRDNPFYGEIVSGAECEASALGYDILIKGIRPGESCRDWVCKRNLDGAIFIGNYTDLISEEMQSLGKQLVLVDCYDKGTQVHSNIGIDDENGGYLATKYLLENEHKRIALASSSIIVDGPIRRRYLGYKKAMNEAGIADVEDLVFHDALSFDGGYRIVCENKESYDCDKCIVSVGRSGSKWMEKVCGELGIPTKSNRVDIGVRVELPAVIFSHLTDELYESKIVYRTEKFEDRVRTFCMNPNGIVVNENTNGIITVNGHSYEGNEKKTDNTNFALLVAKHFSEPFKDSNGYGESIARLSNMLGGGVIVQRFGDLVRGRRSTEKRINENLVTPTLSATPGDLSLVLPKRIMDGIIEMIYALDKVAPGTANDDTLLYGVEVKFYNMEVELDQNLESCHRGLYVIGDGSGVTHSLSHASASGVYVARHIIGEESADNIA